MRTALAMVTICLAACSKDDGGGGAFAPIDQLDSVYAQTICQHYVTCGEFPDLATCEAANVGAFPLQLAAGVSNADVVAAVLGGKVIYDGNKMEQCIEGIAGVTCDATDADGRSIPAVCADTVRGTIAGGDACYLGIECVSQICTTAQCASPSSCCLGTCGTGPPPVLPPPIAIGEPCTVNGPACADGAFCFANTGTCTALQPQGAACTDATQCAYGLGCLGQTTCEPLPTLGQPCPEFQCRDEGTTCSATTMTCTAVGLVGDPCASPDDCSVFYACDLMTQLCTQNPRIGEPCVSAACFDAGAYCDLMTQLCTAAEADGQPCTESEQCLSGQCSDDSDVCVTPPTCS